ncbi:MAG: HAD-IIIA family hydrolase [Bacteroidota bacterium]
MKWKVSKEWTLFLDRDGVINKRIPDSYVQFPNEFIFIKNVVDTIAKCSGIFGTIVVVTNQQGIGKGLMTERNLEEVHRYMLNKIEDAGGKIAKVYFAPQMVRENSPMRKPNIGMGLQAQKDFPMIDFSKAIMIGDSNSDIEFGKNLGMKTVKVGRGRPDSSNADAFLLTMNGILKLIEV